MYRLALLVNQWLSYRFFAANIIYFGVPFYYFELHVLFLCCNVRKKVTLALLMPNHIVVYGLTDLLGDKLKVLNFLFLISALGDGWLLRNRYMFESLGLNGTWILAFGTRALLDGSVSLHFFCEQLASPLVSRKVLEGLEVLHLREGLLVQTRAMFFLVERSKIFTAL